MDILDMIFNDPNINPRFKKVMKKVSTDNKIKKVRKTNEKVKK